MRIWCERRMDDDNSPTVTDLGKLLFFLYLIYRFEERLMNQFSKFENWKGNFWNGRERIGIFIEIFKKFSLTFLSPKLPIIFISDMSWNPFTHNIRCVKIVLKNIVTINYPLHFYASTISFSKTTHEFHGVLKIHVNLEYLLSR